MNADNTIDISTEKYTDEQKQKDIILSGFQNISKYIESDKITADETNINIIDLLINDYDLAKYYNDRYEFYKELTKIIKHDPRIFKMIIKLNNKIKKRKKKEKKIIQVLKGLDFSSLIDGNDNGNDNGNSDKIANKIYDKIEPDYIISGGAYDDEITENLKKLFLENNVSDSDKHKYVEKAQEFIKKNRNNEGSNVFQKFIKDYNKIKQGDGDNNKELKKVLNEFKNGPLETLKLTREDRLIFILTTFFIRYITILMVQWCVDINIVKDFYQGFLLYALIYIVIFWFIVMFVNIDTIPYASYMNNDIGISSIRNIFYYFYMGTNGISRLFTHSFLIVLLLLIPIILNIKGENKDDSQKNILNYEERKKLIKTMSLFTIFIWILTSIISIKF